MYSSKEKPSIFIQLLLIQNGLSCIIMFDFCCIIIKASMSWGGPYGLCLKFSKSEQWSVL